MENKFICIKKRTILLFAILILFIIGLYVINNANKKQISYSSKAAPYRNYKTNKSVASSTNTTLTATPSPAPNTQDQIRFCQGNPNMYINYEGACNYCSGQEGNFFMSDYGPKGKASDNQDMCLANTLCSGSEYSIKLDSDKCFECYAQPKGKRKDESSFFKGLYFVRGEIISNNQDLRCICNNRKELIMYDNDPEYAEDYVQINCKTLNNLGIPFTMADWGIIKSKCSNTSSLNTDLYIKNQNDNYLYRVNCTGLDVIDFSSDVGANDRLIKERISFNAKKIEDFANKYCSDSTKK